MAEIKRLESFTWQVQSDYIEDRKFQIQARFELELFIKELEIRGLNIKHHRHFIDQWFCYKRGYLNTRNNPDWELINFREYVSENALKVLNGETVNGHKKLIKEHVVPLKALIKRVHQKKIKQISDLEDFLGENLVFAVISNVDDAKIGKKYKSEMPTTEWSCPFERYIENEISIGKLLRNEAHNIDRFLRDNGEEYYKFDHDTII